MFNNAIVKEPFVKQVTLDLLFGTHFPRTPYGIGIRLLGGITREPSEMKI